MAEKMKIIPLGGLNEVGKNMTVYEHGGEIIVVDCGMGFPDGDMYGIDLVIPDVTYLVKNRNRIRGLFITHGHEDHIGAIPYILKQVNMPVYCTRLTAGLIKLKLEEHGLTKQTKLITVEAGEMIRVGKFYVEFIHVNHSIADSVAFAIHTSMGVLIHTGDFKIDSTPIDGDVIDLGRFGELGKEGVLALLADSTNVERPGYTMSESIVGRTFDRLFTGCKIVSLNRMEVGKGGEKCALDEIRDLYGFDTAAIVTMAEVVERLYQKECNGKIVIDDRLKEAIDAYYKTYGV